MRWPALVTLMSLTAVLGLTGSQRQPTCAVTLSLTDARTGAELPGLVRIVDAAGRPVVPPGLISRGQGLDAGLPISHWYVLPGRSVVELPATRLTIEAISGLETELAAHRADLSGKAAAELALPLLRFYRAAEAGYRSGNTHLHLQKLSREECDRYLAEVPRADGLEVLFLSYLERAVADREYTSNQYTNGDLQKLSRVSGVLFGNGEEHRHNFTAQGEGYGHVMLLDLQKLIQPASIGPGIMQMGTDGLPLQRGIDAARRDAATVIWCHNNWGLEAVPNFVTGRIDAQNIFDGGTHGSYKDSFYRYLNAGLRVPFSTGTDWFMYDFSRVYAEVRGELMLKNWLAAVAAGRTYITNGPLLEFEVNGKRPGETLELTGSRVIRIHGRAWGRSDFGRIEVVRNGKVIAAGQSVPAGGHYAARLELPLKVAEPCWLCLRTPPPPVKGDPELIDPVGQNLLGRELFAHTSAVSVTVGGRRHVDRQVVRDLLAAMQQAVTTIEKHALFADEQERQRVLDVYRDGIARLHKSLE